MNLEGTVGVKRSIRLNLACAALVATTIALSGCSSDSGPASLPPATDGNTASAAALWSVQSADLIDNGLGAFGGTMKLTYSGPGSDVVSPIKVGILKNGAQVGTASGSIPSVSSGNTTTVQVVSTDKFVEGPYTFQVL